MARQAEGGPPDGDDPRTPPSGRSGRWSRDPEDLSTEPLLRNAPKIDLEGDIRPAMGRFALLSKLGQGGMGVVYHGVHSKLGTEVAIKVLPLLLHAQQQGLLERFEREARLAAQLRSDHLVSVLDIDEDATTGCHFIVMEYVRGLAADSWMRRHPAAPRVPEAEALDVCIAATRGLLSAHVAGVVHRDVKPANILVPTDAAGRPLLDRAKLADLGLARFEAGEQSLTGSAIAMGTPGYMSPEQTSDAKSAKKPADVFSMGATLYALLTGNAPFKGSSAADAIVRTAMGKYAPLASVRPDVSAATTELVGICLRPDPVLRFTDAAALLDALVLARTAIAHGDDAVTKAISAFPSFVTREEVGAPVLTPRPGTTEPPPTTLDDVLTVGRAETTAATHAAGTHGAGTVAAGTAPATAASVATPPPTARPETIAAAVGSSAGVPAPPAPVSRGTWVAAAVVVVVAALLAAALWRPGSDGSGAAPGGGRSSGDGPSGATAAPSPGGPSGPIAPTAPPHDAPATSDAPPVPPVTSPSPPVPTPGPVAEPAEGFVSLTSEPEGAEVLVDDAPRGRTPLVRVAAARGVRRIALRLAEHGGWETSVQVVGGEELRLETVRLQPWPVLDLSLLGVGVQAAVDGEPRSGRVTVPPGTHKLVLTRDGFAPQTRDVDCALGATVPPPVESWDAYQACLDLRDVPADAKATVDGALRDGLVGYPSARDVSVAATRPGFRPKGPVTVRLEMGRKTPPGWGDWVPLPPAVDDSVRWRILTDLGAWRSATTEDRRRAAEWVDGKKDGFTLLRLESFTSGGQQHEVAVFRHDATQAEFVLVPGGSLLMGSPPREANRDSDEIQHTVTLAAPYLVARTETTQAAWSRVMGTEPSAYRGATLPVESVSWDEASEFCRRAGLALPTEAQWEWACRAGAPTAYSFGDSERALAEHAWVGPKSGQTHGTAQKKPNAFGLFDMHGNVLEWCESRYAAYSPAAATDAPSGAGPGSRVYRGGSWFHPAKQARSAFRTGGDPGSRFAYLGFRAVAAVPRD